MIQTFCGYTGLVNFICTSFFAYFIFFKNPKNNINRSFSLWQLSVALWSLPYFIWCFSTEYESALFWGRALQIGAAIIPATFLHFVFTYLDIYKNMRNRIIILSAILLSCAIVILDFTPFFITGVEPRCWFKWWAVPGFCYHFFVAYFFAAVIYAHYLFFNAVQQAKGRQRKQLKLVSIGTAVAFIGGSTNFFPFYHIPVPPVLNFLVPTYFALTAYAVLNYQLWQIEVVVRRTVVFSGLMTFALLIFSVISVFLELVLDKYIHVGSFFTNFLSIAIVILFYDRLRHFLVRVTDGYLFQKKYDYKGLLKDASRGIALIQSLDHLVRLIVTFISLRARIKNVATFVSSSDGKMLDLKALRGYDKQTMKVRNIPFDHPLIRMFQASHQAIRISDLKDMKGVSANDLGIIQSEMKKWKAEVIIPSFLGRNTTNLHLGDGASLRSLLVLGCKKSDEEYSDEDLAVFFALAQEAAIAIENARLYDEAVKRAKELQHMNNELDAASSKLMRSLDEVQASKKELEENKAVLVEMKRRENLERLAASIGHELNNPLAVFNMQCSKFARDITKIETALEQMKSGEPENSADSLRLVIQDEKFLLGRFEHFYERIRAVADTVDGLLKAGDRVTGVSLRMILDYSFEEVRFVTYSEKLSETRVEFDVPSQLPPIRGNAFQLQAVFVNLILNAYHALRETPDRKISISAELDSDQKMIRIVFKDNGCGMTRDVLEKCFEYRFTTKGEKGTGIGLTVCKQTIERHGGTLSVESAPGKGTAFTIRLPVWDEKRESQNYFNPMDKQEFGDLEKAA